MAKKTQNEVASAMGIDMSPSLHLSEKDLPALKTWKVGSKYTITLKVEETGTQKSQYEQGNPMSADFKVLSASSSDDEEDDY